MINPENWTREKTLERLKKVHEIEIILGNNMSAIDKEINKLTKLVRVQVAKKTKINKRISSNMRYRNQLIELL